MQGFVVAVVGVVGVVGIVAGIVDHYPRAKRGLAVGGVECGHIAAGESAVALHTAAVVEGPNSLHHYLPIPH